jgi:putative phosphoribosyl transferase
MAFKDRADGGRRLAHRLTHLRGSDAVVLGMARSGATTAFEVASFLAMPLDIVVTERIEDPFLSGLTVGAVAENGITVVDATALRCAGIAAHDLAEITNGLLAEVDRRARAMRAGRAPLSLVGRTALLIDDGVATGLSARAAARVVRARGADRVVLAVPVADADAVVGLEDEIEETVCVESTSWVPAIGRWYSRYPPTTDQEVAAILRRAGVKSPYRPPRRPAGAVRTA